MVFFITGIPQEVDFNLPGGKESYIIYHNISSIKKITLKVWIRFKKENRAIFLTLYATKSQQRIIQITHNSIRIFDERVDLNKSIADGYWHFVAVSLSTSSTQPLVILNGDALYTDNLTKFSNRSILFPTCVLSIGSVFNGSSTTFVDGGFIGQFSQLSLLKSQYDNAMFNCSYNTNGKDSFVKQK